MINSTSINIPKKYKPAIRDVYKDQDEYWVTLNNGYYASGMGGYDECHTIHEDTQAEVLEQIRQIEHL